MFKAHVIGRVLLGFTVIVYRFLAQMPKGSSLKIHFH